MEGQEFLKKVKTSGIVISRLPKNSKEKFIQLAMDEFADDYGMTLKYLIDNYELWKDSYRNINIKINHMNDMLNSINNQLNEQESSDSRKEEKEDK